MKKKKYDIDPYVLGVILGDGSCIRSMVNIYNPLLDKEIMDKVKRLVEDDRYFIKEELKRKSCPRYTIALRDKSMKKCSYMQKIKKLGLDCKSINKFIPQEYLEGSIEQRLELLRGLMDTDGSCTKRKINSSTHFSTSSERLMNDVKQLVFSLGGVCRIQTVDKRGKNTSYTLMIQINLCPFYLSRKAKNWTPYKTKDYLEKINYLGKEDTVCIKVDNDDELYLTSDYVITHNTSILSLLCKTLYDKRTLITNGNNFILQQIYERLLSFGITDVSWNPSDEPDYTKRIVLINTSSSDSRLNRQDENYLNFLKEVQLWIIDEAAHFQSLTNFEPIFYMDHDKLEHIVGYTATPFRNYKNPYENQDDFTLISLLGEPAFVYQMKDTISDNNIAQPYSYFINYPNKAGFVPPQFKDNYYMQYRANITYNKARNKAGIEMLKFLNKNGIKTLAYVNNIKPGQALLKSLKEEGVNALFICGNETIYEYVETQGKGKAKGTTVLKLEERKGNIDDIKSALDSGYNIILGSSVMSEGVDISTFQAALLCSAGKSYIGIVQIAGRAARKKEKNNICFIIDFKDTGGYYAFSNQYEQRKQAMLDSGVINIPDVHKFIQMVEELGKSNNDEK